MNLDVQKKFKRFYAQMMKASRNGNREEADRFRIGMEELRLELISARPRRAENISLPRFAKAVLDKNHHDLGIDEAANCINAAMNFDSASPVFAPFSPMDLLKTIRNGFVQLASREKLRFGDWVVFWSRNGNEWSDRGILVSELDPERPGFPFGLVFDHVAVYLGEDLLFHKPDPTLTSRYQVNAWDDVVALNQILDGFELTFHTRLTSTSASPD